MPVAFQDLLREEANTTVAEAQGRGGEVVDVLAVQEVPLQRRCSDAVGGLVGARRQEASFSDRRFLRPFAFATKVEGRHQALTQWAHAISPF